MPSRKESNSERHWEEELRPADPYRIASYVRENFDTRVRVQFAPRGETITIPDGWHGAGKEGEVLVHVGDLLTKPISGTKLAANDFLRWGVEQGFRLVDGEQHTITTEEGNTLLEGKEYSWADNKPLLRLTRTTTKTPIEIQFYGGAANPWLQTLSMIGNSKKSSIGEFERDNYRRAVRELFRPFISKGSKEERARLGVNPTVDILRRVDDCAASLVTIIGDQVIDDKMQISQENLLEIHDLSVATLQAVVLAITMADRRHVALLMRIGAPAFALGRKQGLNYMMNTLPEMRALGPMAVGDMGTIMDEGSSVGALPHRDPVRPSGDASRELRLFLGAGLPVSKMMSEVYDDRGKPMGWDLAIRRASRVDNGPDNWAVLVSGTDVTVRTARRDRMYLPAGTELVDHENMPFFVGDRGLWVSGGKEADGWIPVGVIERGKSLDLYLPAKEHPKPPRISLIRWLKSNFK